MFLDENCTCFVRDGKTYCKKDYVRLFGAKCDKCGHTFGKSDYVMRARNRIFHLDCFKCIACERQLIPGDSYALKDDGLYCNEHHKGPPGKIPGTVLTGNLTSHFRLPRM